MKKCLLILAFLLFAGQASSQIMTTSDVTPGEKVVLGVAEEWPGNWEPGMLYPAVVGNDFLALRQFLTKVSFTFARPVGNVNVEIYTRMGLLCTSKVFNSNEKLSGAIMTTSLSLGFYEIRFTVVENGKITVYTGTFDIL